MTVGAPLHQDSRMRYALVVLALAACSSPPPAAPATNDTDARICKVSAQVPWPDSIVGALVENPTTPIQQQASVAHQVWDAGHGGVWPQIDKLNEMCVDAGY